MPATNGQAMLVPALIRLQRVEEDGGAAPASARQGRRRSWRPGAATSGFLAPSRRGPSLLKSEMVLSSRADCVRRCRGSPPTCSCRVRRHGDRRVHAPGRAHLHVVLDGRAGELGHPLVDRPDVDHALARDLDAGQLDPPRPRATGGDARGAAGAGAGSIWTKKLMSPLAGSGPGVMTRTPRPAARNPCAGVPLR